jgi:tetratricopeptide (TPR) repeat protein/tRNA A-37 threonylcarbamoyl transferase component Bud32
MNIERDLLFGVLAFQGGAVDADGLAEACTAWADEKSLPLADLLVSRGLITDQQRMAIEDLVVSEIDAHGGNPRASLEAVIDGRSLAAIRDVTGSNGSLQAKLKLRSLVEADDVVIAKLSPSEAENKERYTLTHLHAKGGMARVWLARDSSLGRQIALKELRPDQVDNSVVCSRFLREARITAQLEHPGIVPVYEVSEGNVPYYTMRFVQGRTLSAAIRAYQKKRTAGKTNPVGLVELLTAFVGICRTVAYAHSRGIIHRDLKGQNIILGEFGEVMVLDWGLAKCIGLGSHASCQHDGATATVAAPTDPDETLQGQLLGTPAFMAPEQASGRHDLVDERSDVYGLGAILYEILTGRPPFTGPKASEVVYKVCHEAPTPPRQIVSDMAPGFVALEAICLKTLEKRPEHRYASAVELAQEVQRWLADEPVRAFPERWTVRVLRWGRRHRTIVSAAAALLVTTAVALAVSTVLVAREAREAQAQGDQARRAVGLLTRVSEIGLEDQLDPIQQEFLDNALDYYEQFTGRIGSSPTIRLEHARAYQQMGNIERKLGRLSESERVYRRAIETLKPLARDREIGHEVRRVLARTYTLLADLLVRGGDNKGQADPLYQQAVELQLALAGLPKATPEDQLHLGQTLKSRADLMRRKGRLGPAKSAYDEAIAALNQGQGSDAGRNQIRNDLALAYDARGWVYRELGALDAAENDYRRAVELLELLVREFPTVPGHREALARAYNSLGMIEERTGLLADAELYYRRELPLADRLVQDYPDRPEYHRVLARTLSNLGNVLARKRDPEADSVLHRAVEVNRPLAAKYRDDPQIRFDLAKDFHCLGVRQIELAHPETAIGLFRQAQPISESLVKKFPDEPRYAELLAQHHESLGSSLSALGQPEADQNFRTANSIYEELVTKYSDHIDYQLGQAHCLREEALIAAAAGHPEQAEVIGKKALRTLEARDIKSLTPETLRIKASLLCNLGTLKRPGAEQALRDSIAIYEGLSNGKASVSEDRHHLAIAQSNLGDLLVEAKRFSEAKPFLARSVANLEQLVNEAPKAIEYHSHIGIVLALQGKCLDQNDEFILAQAALKNAIDHQRQAIRLSKNGPSYRELLGDHLIELANLDLKLGAYKEAATNVLEVPNAVPASNRARGCSDAARGLARLISQAAADPKLALRDRDQLARNYLGRAVGLLREVIDTNAKLADRIKKDPDIKALASRPEFQVILNSLVDLGS